MRKRKPDPKIIRIGDEVKIVNPELFDGCLYDNNIDDRTRALAQQHGQEIWDFVCKFLSPQSTGEIMETIFEEHNFTRDRAVGKIANAIAYELVGQQMRLGNEKKIVARLVPEYLGDVMTVRDIKFVHTGKYHPSETSRSYYDGEIDYIPAYLYDRKVHKILRIDDCWEYDESDQGIWIEAKNVVKETS